MRLKSVIPAKGRKIHYNEKWKLPVKAKGKGGKSFDPNRSVG